MIRAVTPEGLASLSGRELAEHLHVLRERIDRQNKEWDVLLDVVGAVLETLEDRPRG